MNTRHRIISALAAVALLAAVSVILVALPKAESAVTVQPAAAAPATAAELTAATASLEAIQLSFRDIARRVLPVVVEIDVTETVTQAQGGSPFDFFGNRGGQDAPQEFQRSGLGSGIIVRQNGSTVYVLTNKHVVESATDIKVKLHDQRTFDAKVVGEDPRKDLALVSFTAKEALPVAVLGDSGALEAGDLVLAVGNPFGFASSITMGIVSAVGRSGPARTDQYTDYIQTDAAINQGNSGGALVDIRGRVVGREHLDRGAERRQRRHRLRHTHRQREEDGRRLHRQAARSSTAGSACRSATCRKPPPTRVREGPEGRGCAGRADRRRLQGLARRQGGAAARRLRGEGRRHGR